MVNKRFTYALAFSLVSLLAGCSTKENAIEQIKQFDNNETRLKTQIEQKINTEKYISIQNQVMLGDALTKLGEMSGGVFILMDKDFLITPSNFKVKNFDDLDRYLQSTMNKKLLIVKNKYDKRLPKVVKVRDTRANVDFEATEFDTLGEIPFKQVQAKIFKATGFSLVANWDKYHSDLALKQKDTTVAATSSNAQLFKTDLSIEKRLIAFKGNVRQFLDYIGDAYKVFVTVDYDTKTIKLEREKPIKYNLALSKKSVDKDSYVINTIFSSLDTQLKNLLGADKVTLNAEQGQAIAIVDKDNYDIVGGIVSDFNNYYSQRAEVRLSIYEIVLDKNFALGTDISTSGGLGHFGRGVTGDISAPNKLASGTGVSGLLTYQPTNSVALGKLIIDSSNAIGKLVNVDHFDFMLRNGVLLSKTSATDKDYIKSNSSTVTAGTTPIVNTNQEIKTASTGYDISILPSIQNEKASLDTVLTVSRLKSLEKNIDNNVTTMLPETQKEVLKQNILMHSGESVIIGSVTSLADSHKYQGILPIENFIIGGGVNSGFVRTEKLYVLTVTKL